MNLADTFIQIELHSTQTMHFISFPGIEPMALVLLATCFGRDVK